MFPCFLLLLWLSSVRALLVDRPPRNEVSNPLTIQPNQAPSSTAHFPEKPPIYAQGIPIDLCLTRANLDLDSSSCQLRRRVFFSSPIWRQRLGLFSLSSWRQYHGLQPINVRADPTTRAGLGFLRDLGSQPRKFFYLPPSQRANYLGLKLRPYDASSESQFFPAANASLSTFYFSNSSGQISYFLDSPTNVSPLNTITSSKSPPKLPRPIPALADEVIALDWNRSRAECQSQHLPPVTMNQLKRVLDVPSRLFPQPAFPRQIDHQDLARLVTNMASKALLDHKTRMLNFIQQLLRHFYREVRVLHEITLSMEQWDQFAREQYQIHAIPFPRQAQEFSQLMMVLSNHMSLLTQSELNLFSTQAIIQSLLRQYLQRIPTHV